MIDFSKRRYMTISRFPLSSDPIGKIRNEGEYSSFDMGQFPNIYRLMKWWEYRAPEEMPPYVKKISDNDGYHVKDDVLVVEWVWNPQNIGGKGESKWVAKVGQHCYNAAVLLPITKEEYERRSKSIGKIDFSKLSQYEAADNTTGAKEFACVAGVCEI